MLYPRIGETSHQAYMPRRKLPHSMKCGLYARHRKLYLKQKKMWDERRKHLPPWPREREILANFIHEEQNTNTCPKSNVLDAKNMGTTKRIFLNLRRTTKTREKGKKLI